MEKSFLTSEILYNFPHHERFTSFRNQVRHQVFCESRRIFHSDLRMVDEGTRKTLQSIPLLQTRASPRDKDLWVQRLKEELMALIKVETVLFTISTCLK